MNKKLKIYFKTQQQIAAAIGITQGAVSKWERGLANISAENAAKIEKATGGEITRKELRPDIFE